MNLFEVGFSFGATKDDKLKKTLEDAVSGLEKVEKAISNVSNAEEIRVKVDPRQAQEAIVRLSNDYRDAAVRIERDSSNLTRRTESQLDHVRQLGEVTNESVKKTGGFVGGITKGVAAVGFALGQVKKIAPVMVGAWNVAEGGARVLSGILERMRSLAGGVVSAFSMLTGKKARENIAKVMSIAATPFTAPVKGLMKFGGMLGGVLGKLKHFALIGGAVAAYKGFGQSFEGIGESLKGVSTDGEKAGIVVERLVEGLDNTLDIMTFGIYGKIKDKILRALPKEIVSARKALPNLIGRALGGDSRATKALTSGLMKIFDSVGNWLQSEGFRDFVSTAGRWAGRIWAKLWSWSIKGAIGLVKGLVSGFIGIFDKETRDQDPMSKFFSGLFGGIREFAVSFATEVKKVIGEEFSDSGSFWTKVKEWSAVVLVKMKEIFEKKLPAIAEAALGSIGETITKLSDRYLGLSSSAAKDSEESASSIAGVFESAMSGFSKIGDAIGNFWTKYGGVITALFKVVGIEFWNALVRVAAPFADWFAKWSYALFYALTPKIGAAIIRGLSGIGLFDSILKIMAPAAYVAQVARAGGEEKYKAESRKTAESTAKWIEDSLGIDSVSTAADTYDRLYGGEVGKLMEKSLSAGPETAKAARTELRDAINELTGSNISASFEMMAESAQKAEKGLEKLSTTLDDKFAGALVTRLPNKLSLAIKVLNEHAKQQDYAYEQGLERARVITEAAKTFTPKLLAQAMGYRKLKKLEETRLATGEPELRDSEREVLLRTFIVEASDAAGATVKELREVAKKAESFAKAWDLNKRNVHAWIEVGDALSRFKVKTPPSVGVSAAMRRTPESGLVQTSGVRFRGNLIGYGQTKVEIESHLLGLLKSYGEQAEEVARGFRWTEDSKRKGRGISDSDIEKIASIWEVLRENAPGLTLEGVTEQFEVLMKEKSRDLFGRAVDEADVNQMIKILDMRSRIVRALDALSKLQEQYKPIGDSPYSPETRKAIELGAEKADIAAGRDGKYDHVKAWQTWLLEQERAGATAAIREEKIKSKLMEGAHAQKRSAVDLRESTKLLREVLGDLILRSRRDTSIVREELARTAATRRASAVAVRGAAAVSTSASAVERGKSQFLGLVF